VKGIDGWITFSTENSSAFSSEHIIMVLAFSSSAPLGRMLVASQYNSSFNGKVVRTTSQKPSFHSASVKRTAPRAQLRLFENVNFSGGRITVTGDTPELTSFNDKVSSIQVDEGEQWILYSRFNFQGQGIILGAGQYNTMSSVGMGNDILSSVRRVASSDRPAIMVFEDEDWRGDARTFTNANSDVRDFNFNDKISSLIVLGSDWEVFDNIEFRGASKQFSPGAVSSLKPVGFNDKISSLRPI